jgi:hypothetical protein
MVKYISTKRPNAFKYEESNPYYGIPGKRCVEGFISAFSEKLAS